MDSSLLAITGMSFLLSFIFALGGVGSALVLIPAITWLGLPLAEARSIGLFVNGVSMMGQPGRISGKSGSITSWASRSSSPPSYWPLWAPGSVYSSLPNT